LSRILLTQIFVIFRNRRHTLEIRSRFSRVRSSRSLWRGSSESHPAEMCGIGGPEATTPSPESDPHATARSITRGVHHHGVPPSSLYNPGRSPRSAVPQLTFANHA
ncbi:hypothetical protein DBV15_04744, partial [Temnothorax longispinosus]